MADDHVHQAERTRPLRDSTRFVGRAVIHDNDFERPQGCCCSDAIVGSSPEPPLKVGMMTLTEALLAGTLSLRLHAPNSANESSDSE